ncbi:hypothetical protein GCM10011497_11200 [Elstera cyanobacteriorum]|uniref:YlxR domain-containing protein n=1 Tax=Elstera cyanobacteriorum TaxID=2022747 RepID=A0A255XMD1_9PROT|nr:RNA-binding protein [Elstera cyanobacteriorum]OYQ18062.1 hypothetical protein CHR90_13950 [Elstera cyanobacteriorum]GFZ84074.1 hypothetical protein GCM10011497_11200 [Elstera cyanobacteriorum]
MAPEEVLGEADDAFPDHGPARRCVATFAVLPKAELLRCVVAPDGSLVPDLDGKLPGRGLYVTPDRAAIETALKKRAFAKAAKRSVQVPDDWADRLAGLIAVRCGSLLGLARRAGQAVIGYDQAESWIRAGRAALLVQACDAAAGGRSKLSSLFAAARAQSGRPSRPENPGREWSLLTAAELAAPFGRDHLVHVALSSGGLALRLDAEFARLSRLRADG